MTRTSGRGHHYVMDDEQREWLVRWFPTVANCRLAKAMKVSLDVLKRLAKSLQLKKSEQGLKAIKRLQIREAVKTCEKNGHYAQMRGRRPSEATRQGAKQMWADIRAGKRVNHVLAMREKHPQKFKNRMRVMSAERKEMIRKEKLRMVYGLERHTTLQLALTPFRQSQLSHRYSALNRGYLLTEDCSEGSPDRYTIFYDKDTQRSEQFEQNCKNDGFRIEPL